MQAISRVNRIFRDKPEGLIVDFIGIGEELKEAAKKYTQGGGPWRSRAGHQRRSNRELSLQALANVRDLVPELPAGNEVRPLAFMVEH